VVRRLRAAGCVIVAKTNMVEFAFSALGLNPHYGTPGNPADRTRLPGGSSSGAAVAVADGMCEIAIGSDTGGSTRAPAAFCGIVGFKPSKQRVPTAGGFPLSYTLDSIGPLARTVADCAAADAVMAGEEFGRLEPAPLPGLRLGMPQPLLRDLDETVAARFSAAIVELGKIGARLDDEPGYAEGEWRADSRSNGDRGLRGTGKQAKAGLAKGKRTIKAAACPICEFQTTPPHDGRTHRNQKKKSAFSAAELKEKGLVKV
jgi:Asp-tRNA(Asn)/Glu-tRNA(Gln) amidotransferase A subunit family amidase